MTGAMLPMQEMGWFDREENASGALSSRLSADTAAIRGALGDQIGLMVQNLVTFAGASLVVMIPDTWINACVWIWTEDSP